MFVSFWDTNLNSEFITLPEHHFEFSPKMFPKMELFWAVGLLAGVILKPGQHGSNTSDTPLVLYLVRRPMADLDP